MATFQSGDERADNDDVHAFILAMANELADMAERIQDSGLAERLRLAAWPGEQQGRRA